MTETPADEHAAALRRWAEGMLPLEAATELLIRTGFAGSGRPWVRWDDIAKRPWIDFQAIPDAIGAYSGGEQRLLRIAASLAVDEPIVLGDEISGLDRAYADLVLAAIAHAADFHTPGRTIELIGDTPRFVDTAPLYTWPERESV